MSRINSFTVKSFVLQKANETLEKYTDIQKHLCNINPGKDIDEYKNLTRSASGIEVVCGLYQDFINIEAELNIYRELEQQEELTDAYLLEANQLVSKQEKIYRELVSHLANKDPNSAVQNIFIEIRAGTGGDEASLFASELAQMYLQYSTSKSFTTEVVTSSPGDRGGFKEIILKITGKGVYLTFLYEAGVHRVQRVPATENQGRVHTSTCTVAIVPVPETDSEEIIINPADLRIDTFKASGAGGQHVNKTDSAVRIVHLPTKLKVECQNDRSQHRNREQAMQILKSRLIDLKRKKAMEEISLQRREQMGTGDRSERIRTYNYPQKRVTDHRINLTLHRLDAILAGDLEEIIQNLITKYEDTET